MTGSAQLDRENQMVHGLCERRRETAILRLKVVNPNRLAVVVSRKRTEPCRNSQSACHSEIMRKHLKPTISWNSETTTRSKDPPSYIIHIRTYVHTPWINLGNSYEKGDMFSCGNHSGISLIGTATKLVASTVLHWLFGTRERCMCGNQAGFRPDLVRIDQFFTLRQISDQRHIPQTHDFSLSSYGKGILLSLSCSSLAVPLIRPRQRFFLIIHYQHANSRTRVRA